MTVVLHVTESFASGVAAAISDFVESTPEFEHHLLFNTRSDAPISSSRISHFSSAHEMANHHLQRLKQIRKLTTDLEVDVVHAHSTYAGFYTRIPGVIDRRRRVVYSPHCFAFEKLDLSPIARRMIYATELLLASRGHSIAACSPREVALAKQFRKHAQVVLLPNVLPGPPKLRSDHDTPVLTVMGAGRMGSQKDPMFFGEVAKTLLARRDNVNVVWLGGGTPEQVNALTEVGVEVSGWLEREDVIENLATADIYLHTARWEGYPISVLEAVAAGSAALVRRTSSTSYFPDDMSFESPEEAATQIDVLASGAARSRQRSSWGEFTKNNTKAVQRAALVELYRTSPSTTSASINESMHSSDSLPNLSRETAEPK